MRIDIVVTHHFPDGGDPTNTDFRKLEVLMSVVADRIAEVKTSFDAAIARLQAEAVTQADLDALDALKAQADQIAPEVTPAPTPAPDPNAPAPDVTPAPAP